MASARVLALDIGSSSVRTLVVDAAGRACGPARRTPYADGTARDGGARFDPLALLADVERALDGAAAETAAVDGVGVSCFWHSMLAVDAELQPLTDVLTWAYTDAEPAAAALRRELDAAAVHQRTGSSLHSSYVPAKLRWLADTRPRVVADTRWWADLTDWLFARLFGGAPRSTVSMASASGLLDVRACTWDEELLAHLGLSAERLPAPSEEPRQGLRDEYARRWPVLADVPWVPAFGDGACSNVGAGAVGADRAALNIGTSGALRVVWEADHVDVPRGLWCYRVDRRRFIMGGAVSNGGNLYDWLNEVLDLPPDAEARLAGRRATGHGLTLLPLLAGERSPGYAPAATGAVVGLQQTTDALDLLQAGLESVALALRSIWELLRKAHPQIDTVVATGGGMRESALWRQIVANALDHALATSPVSEGSARGAALLALEALGHRVDLRAVKTGPVVEADRAGVAALDLAYARQQHLYDLLMSPTGPRLA